MRSLRGYEIRRCNHVDPDNEGQKYHGEEWTENCILLHRYWIHLLVAIAVIYTYTKNRNRLCLDLDRTFEGTIL